MHSAPFKYFITLVDNKGNFVQYVGLYKIK
jgi:hypothetical protein